MSSFDVQFALLRSLDQQTTTLRQALSRALPRATALQIQAESEILEKQKVMLESERALKRQVGWQSR